MKHINVAIDGPGGAGKSTISKEIAKTAYAILLDEWTEGKPIRMITVSATNLVRSDMASTQISFFDDNRSEKREKSKKIYTADLCGCGGFGFWQSGLFLRTFPLVPLHYRLSRGHCLWHAAAQHHLSDLLPVRHYGRLHRRIAWPG